MKYVPLTAALVIVLIGAAITLSIWSSLQSSNDRLVKEAVASTAEYAQLAIEKRIDSRMDALQRLANRWVEFGPLERERWELDASMIYDDFAGFQAIEWIDKDFFVRWIVPILGNEAAQDLNLMFEPGRRDAIEVATDTRSPTTTPVIELVQGGKGFLVYFPLYRADEFEGLMLGVFRMQELFGQIMPREVSADFDIAIFNETEQILMDPSAENSDMGMAASRVISMPGITWQLRIAPKTRFKQELYQSVTNVSVFSGVVITLLVAISIYFAIAFWMRRREVQDINHHLSEEVALRKKAEQDLYEHLARLEKTIGERTEDVEKANTELRKEIDLHRKARTELEQHQTRLRHLTSELSISEERFRKIIAERIHDRLSNGLILAKMRLGALAGDSTEPAAKRIREIDSLIATVIDESRSMVFEISPPILFELGLTKAVEWYANSTLGEHDLEFSLDQQDEFRNLRPEVATAMYRAFTELCMNVIKHAGASHVHVEVMEKDGHACIAVSDDGCGIETGPESATTVSNGGYGLFSIRERFIGFGGQMTISKSDLGGARVFVSAPIKGLEAAL